MKSMELTGFNSIPKDSYFVRVKADPGYFIHLEVIDQEKKEISYRPLPGFSGACIFPLNLAQELVQKTTKYQLEEVKVLDILGNDGSLN